MASLIFERISSSSSSYSSSTHGRKYDVFLSFSGEEPRHGFTDHLYEELRRKRIHVCRDDEKLQGGEVVPLDLMKAIEESQYAIVVLSEKFADSTRCLDELAKIVECREKTGLSIFPVFDHVDPSDVHNQKGPFETVFAKHEADDRFTIEKKQKWMDALRDVSNISGWCLHDRSESTVIQNIVERMHSELYGEFESVSKDLVGMESSIEGLIDLLDKGLDDVRFVGIWGCGGVGKTTLAQVIYCKISNQFDTKSFICFGSVGQSKNDYLVPIQKLLLSHIFAKRELNITSVHEGKKVIKQMLCSRKVLIVLDNVNDKGQLDAIAESRDWFGAGSRLIITSRDKQLLTSYNVDMYEAKTLDNDKALELFSRKAFKQPHPKKDFVDLSNDFVKYAQGLPLFLEVFGSSLHKEGIEVWKIFLDQLNENSSGEIMERLEISYKRILDPKAKELFLDIAFFFKGMDKNRVANILNDPSYWENIDILKKKSLITILGRKIWMHDLLQEMGREIVRREAPQEPGIRSRLWHHKDIFSILKNNIGTKRVEGMMLNFPPNKEDLNANCFSEMTRLRLINICNVLLPHGLNYLSNELQMMEWNDYPLKFMPRNFRPSNLVELIMHHSQIEQLPEEFTNLDQLKLMDFSYSQNLIKTPDFIGFRNLETLIFQGCTRLYKVQPSVVALRWLTLLNLKDCKHLKSLPYEIDLESLEIFILSGCSRLKKFSEIGRNMTRLSELYLDGTAIEELPPSIKHLTGLTLLNLKDCNDLLSFPSVICSLTSLEILTLSGCRGRPRKPLHLLGLSPMASSIGVNLTFKGTILLLIMSFLVLPYNYLSFFVCATLTIWTYCFLSARYPEPEPINLLLPKSFSGLSSLKSLDLSDCNLSDGALPEDLSCLFSLRFLNLSKNNFKFLPDSISQLSKLKLLCLDNCSNLQSLPYLPSSTNFVMARGCTSLENYSKKVVVWTSGETGFTFINCLSLVEEEDKITEVSLLGSLLEDEGSKRTEVSLLDIHFQPLWQRYMEGQIRESEGFCCVLPQSEITEWFKNQNCGSYVLIPLHRYNISLRGIALCVDFEVHKNSNEVSPGQDAKFICRLYIDGAPRDPIVYTVPRDKICVGSFGIWLYISHKRIREVDQCDCIRPLIRTNSADIEIKGCGARILYESDVVGFVQHLSQNIFGSPDDLRRGSEDFIKYHLDNSQSRDDKVESSQSNALIEPSPRLRSALWSLLSRLYEGDHAQHHYYDYIFPQIAIPRDWFRYQNLESYIKMELPPNLHDNSTWMGRPQTMPKLLPTNEIVAKDCTSPKNQVIAMSAGNSSPFKIVRGCGGFPLALEVIARLLDENPVEAWCSIAENWSNSHYIFNSNSDLLDCLRKSLEFSDHEVIFKECFMVLGSFPEDQRIPVAALIDLWAKLHKLDEVGNNAIHNLHKIATRNLANLVMERKDASKINKYYDEDIATQNDVLRELAIFESCQGPERQRQRLIMDISGNTLPSWCTKQDLGSFPEDQRIPVAAPIDLWPELHKLDEVGNNAIHNLHELTSRNLANLVMKWKDASKINKYYDEDIATQKDVLRELAILESCQGSSWSSKGAGSHNARSKGGASRGHQSKQYRNCMKFGRLKRNGILKFGRLKPNFRQIPSLRPRK